MTLLNVRLVTLSFALTLALFSKGWAAGTEEERISDLSRPVSSVAASRVGDHPKDLNPEVYTVFAWGEMYRCGGQMKSHMHLWVQRMDPEAQLRGSIKKFSTEAEASLFLKECEESRNSLSEKGLWDQLSHAQVCNGEISPYRNNYYGAKKP